MAAFPDELTVFEFVSTCEGVDLDSEVIDHESRIVLLEHAMTTKVSEDESADYRVFV